MSDKFLIPNVPAESQRDNVYFPSSSCFNTELSNCMQHCLNLIGKDKTAVGCQLSMQLEDYIYLATEDATTKAWIKANISKLGSWVLNYSPRTVYSIETYVFNRLMNPLGFKATFLESISYDKFCEKLEQTNLPMVIGGNFSSISAVSGHMLTAVGFNCVGMPEIIVNDSWGNGCTRYTDIKPAKEVAYSLRFFQVSGKNLNVVCIEKI